MLTVAEDEDLVEGPDRAAGFSFSIATAGVCYRANNLFMGGWGWADFYDKPWEEVVCANSPHFPSGKCEVTVTMTRLPTESDGSSA